MQHRASVSTASSREWAGEVRLERVADTIALERLGPAWSALHARCRDATPFQSPEWLLPWWRHVGEGELYAFAALRDDALVGVLPMYIWTRADSRREVLLLGAGTSDYLDALCEPRYSHALTRLLLAQLELDEARWDICSLSQLRPGAILLDMPSPPGWREDSGEAESCPNLDLRGATGLDGCVPRAMQQNVRYYRRRAERLGTLDVIRATERDAQEMFERLLLLHGLRWSTRGSAGVLAMGAVQEAHRAALLHLVRRNMLRLYELRIAGCAAACLYCLADPHPGGRFYYYIGGFDPGFASVSPGNLLIAHAVQEAIDEGASAFDFLRGREHYKYLWGAHDEPTHFRQLARGSAPAHEVHDRMHSRMDGHDNRC